MAPHNPNGEIAAMESMLAKLEYRLQAYYISVGKNFLDLASRGQREVDKLVDDIILTRKNLSAAQQEIKCGECLAFNPAGALYCNRCGKPLEPDT